MAINKTRVERWYHSSDEQVKDELNDALIDHGFEDELGKFSRYVGHVSAFGDADAQRKTILTYIGLALPLFACAGGIVYWGMNSEMPVPLPAIYLIGFVFVFVGASVLKTGWDVRKKYKKINNYGELLRSDPDALLQ